LVGVIDGGGAGGAVQAAEGGRGQVDGAGAARQGPVHAVAGRLQGVRRDCRKIGTLHQKLRQKWRQNCVNIASKFRQKLRQKFRQKFRQKLRQKQMFPFNTNIHIKYVFLFYPSLNSQLHITYIHQERQQYKV
jgi:hypothetical protein